MSTFHHLPCPSNQPGDDPVDSGVHQVRPCPQYRDDKYYTIHVMSMSRCESISSRYPPDSSLFRCLWGVILVRGQVLICFTVSNGRRGSAQLSLLSVMCLSGFRGGKRGAIISRLKQTNSYLS